MSEHHSKSPQVVLRHGGVLHAHGGISVEELLAPFAADVVTVGFAIYQPGASTGPAGTTKPGMEYLLVLHGIVIAEIAGTEYRLDPGDSVHFPTTMAHRGWNGGTAPARALYVNYVPAEA